MTNKGKIRREWTPTFEERLKVFMKIFHPSSFIPSLPVNSRKCVQISYNAGTETLSIFLYRYPSLQNQSSLQSFSKKEEEKLVGQAR